jgi:hypothetical protein
MFAEPQQEHQWLQKLVGEWTWECETPGEAGSPGKKLTGKESVRSLGGLWILAEGQGDMHSVMTLGYDPQKGCYVGTWIGSMMTHLWPYEGELDAEGRALALLSEGPSMAGDGTRAKYRDVIELRSEDHRVLTAEVQGEDGTWRKFMSTHYRRVG